MAVIDWQILSLQGVSKRSSSCTKFEYFFSFSKLSKSDFCKWKSILLFCISYSIIYYYYLSNYKYGNYLRVGPFGCDFGLFFSIYYSQSWCEMDVLFTQRNFLTFSLNLHQVSFSLWPQQHLAKVHWITL